MKYLYNIFISFALLSVLLMTINRIYGYIINNWYISGTYILMWLSIFFYTISKMPKQSRCLKNYIPSIVVFFVILLNVLHMIRKNSD